MIDSFFDTLASVLEAGCWVSLTIVDRKGDVHTCPARALPGTFRGQIWLRLGREADLESLFDGADATVSFAGAAEGPYVTVKGWAIRFPAEDLSVPHYHPAWSATHRPGQGRPLPLVCVTATAAQLWESLATGSDPRVFAFPAPEAHHALAESVPDCNAGTSSLSRRPAEVEHA